MYFNPRSREGSDKQHFSKKISNRHFNPRSREGSDHRLHRKHSIYIQFQSTLPRGERLCRGIKKTWCRYFNPRSREGSDNGRDLTKQFTPAFQSTLPRGERQDLDSLSYDTGIISIHAPARGATNPPEKKTQGLQFQSTLPRGERLRR